MNEIMHPGFILILVGVLAMLAPKAIRRILLAVGPLAGLYAAWNLPLGYEMNIGFVHGYQLGIMYVDKLSWIFTFVFSILAVIASLYAANNPNRMEALCGLSYAGCAVAVTLARDWLTLIFFWEALAITSVFLVWCRNDKISRRAGFRYLLVHMLGGNLLLAGIFLHFSQNGDPIITNLVAGPHDVAYWLMLVGICLNVAMIPLNAWLVDAYSNSTITGGVFMSSLTTKVAVYVLIRAFAGSEFIMWGGVIMALYGVFYAVIENDMRRLLSHHIVSQTGFLVAGAGVGTALAMNGATAHAFCHILYKSLLFMCAGSIIYATGITKINKLSGMAKRMPITCICFFIAAFSIAGIPLFNGFVSKTITINAAFLAGHDVVYTLLELASIGTFLSIPLKMGYFIFLRQDDKQIEIKQKLPLNMNLAMCIGAFLCCLYGVCPDLLYRHLPFDASIYQPFLPERILQYVQMLGMAMIPFMLYLKKMEPHTAITLDTDWFYRKPFQIVVREASYIVCATCSALGNAWWVIYEKFMELTANPMQFLDARPFREARHYNPENYRTSVADPMMVTLTVLLCAIGYFMANM